MNESEWRASLVKLAAENTRLDVETRRIFAESVRDAARLHETYGMGARPKPRFVDEWLPMITLWVVVVATLGGLAFVVIQGRREQHQWETFAKTHECHVVERVRGDVGMTVAPIFDAKGGVSTAVGVTSIPGKSAYLCNDGVKYWR